MTNQEILELQIETYDEPCTIREYFKQLLCALWQEGECFCGKRPLGNSGWEYFVYEKLAEKGIIKKQNRKEGLNKICELINEL